MIQHMLFNSEFLGYLFKNIVIPVTNNSYCSPARGALYKVNFVITSIDLCITA